MAFDKSKYDQQYFREHVVRKFLPFNKEKPEDRLLLDWLQQQPNFTQYVKELIRADYYRRTAPTQEEETDAAGDCGY